MMATLRLVRVSGPLGSYADGFREHLEHRGYSPWTVMFDLTSMDRLSRWLLARRLDPAEFTAIEVERFVHEQRGDGRDRRRGPRGLSSMLTYLRGLGVIPEAAPVLAVDPLARLLDEFTAFLVAERGLASSTVWYYRATARRFLSRSPGLAGVGDGSLDGVDAASVRSFVLAESLTRGVGSVKNVVTALRALLRFCHTRGYVSTSLADALPAVASWRQTSPPRTIRDDHLARMLASCDRHTAAGRRDYAILVVLARLGLRIGEVATLTVDDIAWRDGELLVHGKGNRHDRLPLPADAGAAIADYCQWGRHQGTCRGLFLHARAPYGALSSSAVGKVVERACERAGLARLGAHQLRHAAATALRQAGAPLFEIGQAGAAPCPSGHHRRLWLDRRTRVGRGGPGLARRPPMSTLRQAASDYLALRRTLGFKLTGHDRLLADFNDQLQRTATPAITIEAALNWATKPSTAQPIRWRARLCVVRGFARYLHAIDPRVEVPPTDLLPHRHHRPIPYLFTPTEITALIAAAGQLRSPLRAATHQALFGLLSSTGMRVGEAIRLDDTDVDLAGGLITIRETKFGKTRQLPIHASAVTPLRRYVDARNHLCPVRPAASFFISTAGTRLVYTNVRATFRGAITTAKIATTTPAAPKMHALRHSFAVRTLLGWYRDGGDVQARLPLLSAYLGHSHPSSTYWYLQAAPELLALATARLEQPREVLR